MGRRSTRKWPEKISSNAHLSQVGKEVIREKVAYIFVHVEPYSMNIGSSTSLVSSGSRGVPHASWLLVGVEESLTVLKSSS
jgi:hypothetical protein